MTEEELLPDIPNVLMVLDETLSEIEEIEDLSKITKRQLALNQQALTTAVIDLAKFVIAKGYILEILDKALARIATEREDEAEDDPIKNIVEQAFKDTSMYL